jgi:hypothetical protein
MKKTVIVATFLVLALGLMFNVAPAYQFDDHTLVQEYIGLSARDWYDVLGRLTVFDTFGADFINGNFVIYTNWNPGKDGTVSALVKTADIFFFDTAVGDVAIRLDTTNGTGTVFYNPTALTSQDIFKNTAYTYGGKYDEADPKVVPVWTTSSTSTGSTSVVWSSFGKFDTNNTVTIDLASLGITGITSFVWGTATCANDVLAPIPGTLVLLGSSLLGLVGVGLRRKTLS